MNRPLARGFPMPLTPKLAAAYDDLYLATSGDEKTKRRIGNPANLPRPWDPPTCQNPELLRLTPDSGQVVVWSGGLEGRLVGLSGQVVFVL